MAQYIPGSSVTSSAAMSALSHAPAPDDTEVQTRLPSICVDYLSHDWQEEDVWKSWRSMTRHKNEITNGVRLENASWRTWWKQRNKLRTISPETLNWLKDSDVTWLYGPLHTAADPVPPPKVATTEDRLDLMKTTGKKPILKHRSISDMLNVPRSSSPVFEGASLGNLVEEDSDESDRPPLLHTRSDTHLFRRKPSPPRVPSATAINSSLLSQSRDGSESPRIGSDEGSATRRHISFNTFVEQRISIDKPRSVSITPEYNPSDDDTFADTPDEDDEGGGAVIKIRRSSSSSSRGSRSGGIRRPSAIKRSSSSSDKEHCTIAPIAPTMLKTFDSFHGETSGVVFAPPLGSPFSDPSSKAYGQATLHLGGPSSRSPSVSQSPPRLNGSAAPSQWADEDEDFGVGFDYFGGADSGLDDEYNVSSGSTSNGVNGGRPRRAVQKSVINRGTSRAVGVNSGRPDKPARPPSPPKATHPPINGVMPPPASPTRTTAGRSILKNGGETNSVNATAPTSTTVDSVHIPSPPLANPSSYVDPSYFSLNPSPLFPPKGVRYSDDRPEESSVITLDVPTPRGRSTVRIPGHLDRERSSSKGTSSPIGSVSPNSSRASSTYSRPAGKSGVRSPPGEVPPTLVPPGTIPYPPPSSAASVPDNGASPLNKANRKSPEVNIHFVPVLPTHNEETKPSPNITIPGGNSSTRVQSVEEGALDGADGYDYHSTNPTPTNSPTTIVKPFAAPPPTAYHRRTPSGNTAVPRARAGSPVVGFEDDGTLVSRAAEIVSSARGLLGAIWNAGVGAPASPVETISNVTVNSRRSPDA